MIHSFSLEGSEIWQEGWEWSWASNNVQAGLQHGG